MCGVVDGGIVAGLWGYEAGQSGVGDIFGWFVDTACPPAYRARRDGAASRARAPDRARGRSRTSASTAWSRWTGTAATARCWSTTSCPACSSGRRWPPAREDIYRALIEATAFGTRTIIEAFDAAGVAGDASSSSPAAC